MTDDLTFITNEENQCLSDRFVTLIKDTRFFDCLVGYFYTSGFRSLYKSLEATEKIRILIGISTNKKTFDLIQQAKMDHYLSHREIKEIFTAEVVEEMETSKDTFEVREGVQKFIEWLKSGKLEIARALWL